jgi:hypothetical protein
MRWGRSANYSGAVSVGRARSRKFGASQPIRWQSLEILISSAELINSESDHNSGQRRSVKTRRVAGDVMHFLPSRWLRTPKPAFDYTPFERPQSSGLMQPPAS